MDISCAFAPSIETPKQVELAERLGYRRAWLYDSPGVYADVWMVLGLCAERTSRIGLGPGVLVPSLRHPMVNAAAIATLAAQAPDRVSVAVGAGFSGRFVLGERPMRWQDVAEYVRVLRALLTGADAEWEGKMLRMLHPAGYGAARPVDVPILIGADGPKGLAVAAELADGVFSVALPLRDAVAVSPWRALLCFGTVLDDGEDLTSPRVLGAIEPAAAVLYHATYERGGGDAVDGLPGGRAWREAIESVPANLRHLAVHEGHLVETNVRDRASVAELLPLASAMSFVGTAAELRTRLDDVATLGVTEVAYQPAGPDIERELHAFAEMAGL